MAADGIRIATREKSMRRGEEGIFDGILVLEALDALDDTALQRAIDATVLALGLAAGCFERYQAVFAYHGPRPVRGLND